MAQPVDVVVPRRVLLDVEVGLRDVRLGLVVVVVGDEVLDGVVGEELPELVAELRGQRLVVRDDQRRALELLDDPGHGRGLAGARGAEEGLVLGARPQALGELLDRLRLIACRLVLDGCLERRHGDSLDGRCHDLAAPDARSGRLAAPAPAPGPQAGRRPSRPLHAVESSPMLRASATPRRRAPEDQITPRSGDLVASPIKPRPQPLPAVR